MIFAEFLSIALIHILGVSSPGPDMALILRLSLAEGKSAGLQAAAGIGSGIFIHCMLSLVAFHSLISQEPVILFYLKIIAGLYLIYLGVQGLRSLLKKVVDKAQSEGKNDIGPYWQGLMTNLLNPKVLIFFNALFTGVVSTETSLLTKLFYSCYLSLSTMAFFSFFTLLTVRSKQSRFAGFASYAEYAAASAMILLGAYAIFDALG